MDERQIAYPLCLNLPGGDAALIPGSAERGAPQYERGGEPIAIDVQIPPDLSTSFHWFGSFLALKVAPGACGILIATITYPPNGEDGRETCYSQARKYLARREELRAARAAAPVKKTKRSAPKPTPGIQQESFL